MLPRHERRVCVQRCKTCWSAGPTRRRPCPHSNELGAIGIDGVRHYLGELAGVPCVAIGLANSISAPPDFQLLGLRTLFFRVPETLLAIAARAFQIVEWDRTHRYCGRCGAPTRDKASERAKEMSGLRLRRISRVSPA